MAKKGRAARARDKAARDAKWANRVPASRLLRYGSRYVKVRELNGALGDALVGLARLDDVMHEIESVPGLQGVERSSVEREIERQRSRGNVLVLEKGVADRFSVQALEPCTARSDDLDVSALGEVSVRATGERIETTVLVGRWLNSGDTLQQVMFRYGTGDYSQSSPILNDLDALHEIARLEFETTRPWYGNGRVRRHPRG